MALQEKQSAVTLSWVKDLRRRARPSKEPMEFLKLLPEWSDQATVTGT